MERFDMWKSAPRAFRGRAVRKERARRSPHDRRRSYQSRRRLGARSRAFIMRIGPIERNRRRRAVENRWFCDGYDRAYDASVLENGLENVRGQAFEQRVRGVRDDGYNAPVQRSIVDRFGEIVAALRRAQIDLGVKVDHERLRTIALVRLPAVAAVSAHAAQRYSVHPSGRQPRTSASVTAVASRAARTS